MKNMNENVHKEQRMTKRTKIRRVLIRDRVFVKIKISEPFKYFILVSEVEGHILKKALG